jgi:hypothetical protein
MTLTNAKNAGYLDSAGSGKFKLSSVGENLVAITLPGDGGPGRGQNNGAKKKSKKNPLPKRSGDAQFLVTEGSAQSCRPFMRRLMQRSMKPLLLGIAYQK